MATPTWFLDVDGVVGSWDSPHRKHGPYTVSHVQVEGRSYAIEYSPAIVDRINTLHRDGLAHVVWLTTWNEHARAALAPAIGLDDFPVVPEPDPGTTTWTATPQVGHVWWKTGRILEHVAARPDDPYVWTDDLMFKDMKSALRAASRAPSLLMTIMRTPGLTSKDLDQIEDFCRRLAPA